MFGVLAFVVTTGLVPKTGLAWLLTFALGPIASAVGVAVGEGVRHLLGDAGLIAFLFVVLVAAVLWHAWMPGMPWLDRNFHRF